MRTRKSYYTLPNPNRGPTQRCECGQPATTTVYFNQFDARNRLLQQWLPLCDDCATTAVADGCSYTPTVTA